MTINRRVQRINSLLKEVISEVIYKDLKNHKLPPFISITAVEATKDLKYATVYISLLEEDKTIREAVLHELQVCAGYIAVLASKKMVIRYFPALTFKWDTSIENYMQIDSLLKKIETKKSESA